MTTETRAEVTAQILAVVRADEARWAAKVAEEAAFTGHVLLGQGYIVRSENLAIRVRNVEGGVEYVPTFVKPGLPGISCMTREDAERVAAKYDGIYTVEHVKDTAQARLREIRDDLAAFEAIRA